MGARLTRYLFIHWHIYKNAGSSIERLLWESFGDAFAVLDTQPGCDTIDFITLKNYLQENRHIKAVSSHRLHPPVKHTGTLPIVMLRHPADRARSAYRYARRNATVPDHAIASTHDFRGYLAWALNTRGEGAVLRDHQVQYLSNAAYRTQDSHHWRATPADLAQALTLLKHLRAFGLVRRFAESCRLFNAAYRPCLPAMNFHDWSENSTGSTNQSEAEALAEIRDELGDTTWQSLCAANTLDLALYDEGCRLFDMKLQQLDRPVTRWLAPACLFAGRARQRLSAPRGGLGSAMNPLEPAYIRLPYDTTGTSGPVQQVQSHAIESRLPDAE
jgi:hypothetical protein